MLGLADEEALGDVDGPDSRKQIQELRAWAVWRRDDHGNDFEVSRGHTREEAQRRVEELESRGHKQMYWAAPLQHSDE